MLIVMAIGGMIPVFLIALLVERLIFCRVFNTREYGISAAVAVGTIAAFVLYGFGNANGGPWNPVPNGFAYFFSGFGVGFLWLRAQARRAAGAEQDNDLERTFE